MVNIKLLKVVIYGDNVKVIFKESALGQHCPNELSAATKL